MELKYVQSELGLFNDLLLILVDFALFLISKVPCYPLVAGMACFEGSPASCLPFETTVCQFDDCITQYKNAALENRLHFGIVATGSLKERLL